MNYTKPLEEGKFSSYLDLNMNNFISNQGLSNLIEEDKSFVELSKVIKVTLQRNVEKSLSVSLKQSIVTSENKLDIDCSLLN